MSTERAARRPPGADLLMGDHEARVDQQRLLCSCGRDALQRHGPRSTRSGIHRGQYAGFP